MRNDIKLTFKRWTEIENDITTCIVVDPECATDFYVLHNGDTYSLCGVDAHTEPDSDYEDLYVKLLTGEEMGYFDRSTSPYRTLHRPDEEIIIEQMPAHYDYVSFTSI